MGLGGFRGGGLVAGAEEGVVELFGETFDFAVYEDAVVGFSGEAFDADGDCGAGHEKDPKNPGAKLTTFLVKLDRRHTIAIQLSDQ